MQITDCISTKWNALPLIREQPRKCPSWIGLTHIIKATESAINLKSYKTKKQIFLYVFGGTYQDFVRAILLVIPRLWLF